MKKLIVSIIGLMLLGVGVFAQPANPSFKSPSVVVTDGFYIKGDSSFNANNDSVYIEVPTMLLDSLYIKVLNSPTKYGIIYIDSTYKSIKVDSTWAASKALSDELIPIHQLLSKTSGGEIEWLYYDQRGNPIYIYDWGKLKPGQRYGVIQASIEHTYRYMEELENKNKELEECIIDIEERLGKIEKQLIIK